MAASETVGRRAAVLRLGPGTANFRPLGAVDFGTAPITNVSFRVSVPETESAVQVAFGKIEIEAQRVVEPPRPAGSMFGTRAWLGGGVALVVATGFGRVGSGDAPNAH